MYSVQFWEGMHVASSHGYATVAFLPIWVARNFLLRIV